MAKNTHLTLEDRIIIEVSLKNGESFAEIGRKLEKDPSTISKEVRNHIKIVRNKSYNPCANRASCFKLYVNLALLNSAIYANVALNIAVMNFVQISLN